MGPVVTGVDLAVTLAVATAAPTLAYIPAAADPVLDLVTLIPPRTPATAHVPFAIDPFVRAQLIPPAAARPRSLAVHPGYPDIIERGTLRWALPVMDAVSLRLGTIAARERSPSLYRSELLAHDAGSIRTGNARQSERIMFGGGVHLALDAKLVPRWGLAGPVGKALAKMREAADGGVE